MLLCGVAVCCVQIEKEKSKLLQDAQSDDMPQLMAALLAASLGVPDLGRLTPVSIERPLLPCSLGNHSWLPVLPALHLQQQSEQHACMHAGRQAGKRVCSLKTANAANAVDTGFIQSSTVSSSHHHE
jgi:hypothetical protein